MSSEFNAFGNIKEYNLPFSLTVVVSNSETQMRVRDSSAITDYL